jgi:hypothetical protein
MLSCLGEDGDSDWGDRVFGDRHTSSRSPMGGGAPAIRGVVTLRLPCERKRRNGGPTLRLSILRLNRRRRRLFANASAKPYIRRSFACWRIVREKKGGLVTGGKYVHGLHKSLNLKKSKNVIIVMAHIAISLRFYSGFTATTGRNKLVLRNHIIIIIIIIINLPRHLHYHHHHN